MPASDTKERILDAAEELFAESSYDSTSLRGVTRAADVNLAAVHYHFGSKQALYEAVVTRRVSDVNRDRLERLAALERAAGGGSIPIEALVEALIAGEPGRAAEIVEASDIWSSGV